MRKALLVFIIFFSIILNVIALGILIQGTNDGKIENNANFVYQKSAINAISMSNLSATPSSSPKSFDHNKSEVTSGLVISNVLENLTEGTMSVTVYNYLQLQIALANVTVNGFSANLEDLIVIPANSNIVFTLKFTEGIIFGGTYEISLFSIEGYSASF
jgi:hypothetical protein